jgi:uncharacterized C2H2 Zn-finger protein
MIDRQHGAVLIECDSCDQVFEGEKGESFAEVWARAKEEGWRTRNIAETWLHGCPKCGVPT